MKKKFTFLITAALMLLTMMARPVTVLGQAPVGTTLWAEDFTGYANNSDPSGQITNSHEGTTVYGGVTLTYSKTNGGSTTQTYTSGGPNNNSNLLISKNGGSFTVSGISTGDATELTVTYAKSGSGTVTISSSTTGVTIDGSTITTGGALTIDITFSNSTGNNLRFDDALITVKTAGGAPAVTHSLTFTEIYGTGGTVGTVTVGNNLTSPATVAEGAELNIVATPSIGHVFTGWTVTGEGSSVADATSASTTFTMGTADATLEASFNTIPVYSVTYYANVTGTSPIEVMYNEGDDVTVAANTFTNPGFAFSKWNTVEGGTGTDYMPGDVINDIDDDIELYAQWVQSNDVTDVLNWAATGSPTNYTDWTYNAPSGTVYKGQSSGTYQSIQLRSNNNNSGIVTTSSVGNATKVKVTWNSNTANGRTLNVYGSNSAYSAATDLYGNNAGTLLGTIVYGTSTELNISDSYAYIGLRSANSALYLDEIDITWAPASASTVAMPTFSPASGTEFGNEGIDVTISCETQNADIFYTLDGSTPDDGSTPYNGAIHLTTTTTIKAIAYDGNDASNVATATYTYVDPNAPGTQANPYTVAQARAAIDAGTGTQGVYATGIVSQIVTPWGQNNYQNITFNMVDNSGDEEFLQAFRCVGTEAPDVTVGDIVVVSGNLTKYNNTTYEFAQGCQVVSLVHPAVTVEAPTFSPAAGTYADAQDVTISCATAGVDIYYTLDGTVPTMSSDMYDNPIAVNTTTTIKAIAVNGDDVASTVATATYHICSADDPYTVTQALAFLEYPANGIYVEGIVSTAPTQAPTSNGELTYYISVDGDATNQLEVYKGKGLNEAAFTAQDDIQVGDIVTVYGNVVYYGTTLEFASGNYLVYFERPSAPAVPTITVAPALVEATSAETEGNLAITLENIVITETGGGMFDYVICNSEGTAITDQSIIEDVESWLALDFPYENDAVSVYYVISENTTTTARTAYFKVYGLGDDGSTEAYSNLITVTQEAYVAPPTPGNNYVKVTSTADLTDGQYLIVYEEGGLAFDGSLTTLDAASNTIPVTISNNEIAITTATAASEFTIAAITDGYSIKSASDYYIGQTSDANGMKTSETEEYSNTISIDVDGNADILASGGAYLRYNATSGQERFRYFKSSTYTSQKAIQLYKKVVDPTAPAITVTPTSIAAESTGTSGTLGITLANLTISDAENQMSADFFTATGEPISGGKPDWIEFEFHLNSGNYSATYTIAENTTTSERNAYFKVYGLDDDGTTDAYSNLVSVTQEAYVAPVSTITVTPDAISAPASETTKTLTLTIANIDNIDINNFNADFCNADGTEIQGNKPDFVSFDFTENSGVYSVVCTINSNNADARTAYFKVIYDNGGTNVESNVVTVTQKASFTPVIYTRATSIVSGEHYIIVGFNTAGEAYAMGTQNTNNRSGVVISEDDDDVAIVTTEDVHEFIITSSGENFTIQDAETNGYLYAASSSSNWLRTQDSNDENGIWNIDFTATTVTAQGTNSRKTMRFNYNNGSPIFSCYSSGQQPVYFYVKSSMTPTSNNITIGSTDFGTSTAPTNAGYHLIATPHNNLNPKTIIGMLDGNYDLYYFDQNEELEWRNYKEENFLLESGKGYLYASEAGVTLNFIGAPSVGNGEIDLTYIDGKQFAGWNLIGNPLGCNATLNKAFYRMNQDGDGFVSVTEGSLVNAMEGVFVLATAANQSATFSAQRGGEQSGIAQVDINVICTRGTVIDNAIIRFDEGETLEKFMFNPNNTKIYFTQEGKDYSIIRSNGQGEMPVNFKVAENGTYTFSISAENTVMSYLHLIDNKTGADIDLLTTPSYSFDAKVNDYASRFRLVFSANENETDNEFAFFSNGTLIINNMGEATLQVIDVTGRILSTENFSGSYSQQLNAAPGVYMLRLINGSSVMTQKIVIK